MLAVSDQIDTNRRQVLRLMGYGGKDKPSARILSLVDEYLENYQSLVEPSYSYAIREIESVQEDVTTIEGSITFESNVIARLLEKSDKVAVFALTIGNRLEEMVRHMADNRYVLQATVLDAIGSSVAENLADFVQGKIEELANSQGQFISRRFSPGYCDWGIGQQKMVFQALKGDTAGVRLTDMCLMVPQKSISGIIGICTDKSSCENFNPCITCDKHNCPGRR